MPAKGQGLTQNEPASYSLSSDVVLSEQKVDVADC